MTTTKAYMVAPGNHESECHSPDCLADAKLKVALSNFSAYIKRWKMPYEESGSPCNMWYVLFVVGVSLLFFICAGSNVVPL